MYRMPIQILEICEEENPRAFIIRLKFADAPDEINTFAMNFASADPANVEMMGITNRWESGTLEPTDPDMTQCRRVPLAEIRQRNAQTESDNRAELIRRMQQMDPSISDDPTMSTDEIGDGFQLLIEQQRDQMKRNILNRLRRP